MTRTIPSPLVILMAVIVLAAAATWLVPAGKYSFLSYDAETSRFLYTTPAGDSSIPYGDSVPASFGIRIPAKSFVTGSVRKPVAVPGSYRETERSAQGPIDVIKAPIKGIHDSIDIILFILVIGGFMQVFNAQGAMEKAVAALSRGMKGKESGLIIILTFLFSFAGGSYGMAEEGFVFYAVLAPIFIAAGYDLLLPVAVIFGGTQLGTLASFTNPFSTIIASNAAGVNWTNGLALRLGVFALTTAITIIYLVRYANKIKRDPGKSLVFLTDGTALIPPPVSSADSKPLSSQTKTLLLLFFATFLTMIGGVIWLEWWLTEMTAIFLMASGLVALVSRSGTNTYISNFLKGAAELLPVAFIVGVARGVAIVLGDGNISDTIIFNAAKLVSGMPPALFLITLMLMFCVFTLFISSSSGMAVLTMPIMGSLATLLNVAPENIVNAYLFGMGLMGFLTPTGLILPSLAMVNVSYKAWWRFIRPLLAILLIICWLALLLGLFL